MVSLNWLVAFKLCDPAVRMPAGVSSHLCYRYSMMADGLCKINFTKTDSSLDLTHYQKNQHLNV